MENKTNSIASRIEWCQRQKTQARTQLEREGLQSNWRGSAMRPPIKSLHDPVSALSARCI